MRSLFRLLAPARIAPKAPALQRDRIAVALDDGRCIEVLRVRDPRARRLKLSVDERGARLTLPLRASLVSGERFLREHRDWLAAQLATHADAAGAGLARGHTASLPLRGADLPLRWASGRATRLDFDGDGSLLFATPANAGDAGVASRAASDFYEAQGRTDIGRWLPTYIAGLPRAPRRIVFKRTSSQWGSLAPDGTLSLDLALLLARPSAFEYVLVHELCHLLHAEPLAPVLAARWKRAARLARRTRLLPRRGPPPEGATARPAGRLTRQPALPPAGQRRNSAMTHPAIRLSIAVAVAALLVAPGCKKAQDAALETAIEGATGNKVDVQKDGNEMTIKTEQGDLRIATAEDGGSVAMPANFPKDVFLPAENTLASAMDMGGMQMLNMTHPAGIDRRLRRHREVDAGPAAGSARWRCRPAAAIP
jgi:predicted metal-dependent hydrolase